MSEQRLGRYIIEDQLGEGSFAWVYRGYDEELERHVALKVLKPAWLADPQAVARFKQEARTMAKLHHPNIAVIYEVGEADGQVYLSQFLVNGRTLSASLKEGPYAWEDMMDVLRKVASALDYAHETGMIHRDIKPANILLDENGQAYLGDFGLVRAAEGSASLSASAGGMIGTPAYMAPEQWEDKEISPATDVYALSCVVFEMLTGRMLFDGATPATVMKQHLMEGPKFPEKWPEDVSAGVVDVLKRGLAEEAEDRIGGAGQLVEALDNLGAEEKTAIFTTVPPAWLVTADGQAHKIKLGHTSVGRSQDADIQVDANLISRKHATLQFDGEQVTVRDEGSSNGTFVNGERVGEEPHALEPGDELKLGDVVFAFGTDETPPAPPVASSPPPVPADPTDETALMEESKPAAAEPEPKLAAVAGASPVAEVEPVVPVKKSGGRSMAVIGVVVLLLIIGGAGGLFLLGGGGGSEGDGDQSAEAGQDSGAAVAVVDEEPTATPPPEPTDTPEPEPTDTPKPEPTDTAEPEPDPTDAPVSEQEYEPLPFKEESYVHPSGAFTFALPESYEDISSDASSVIFGDDRSRVGVVFTDAEAVYGETEMKQFIDQFVAGFMNEIGDKYEVLVEEAQPDGSIYLGTVYEASNESGDADFFFEQRETIVFVLFFVTTAYEEMNPTWNEIISSYRVDPEAALAAFAPESDLAEAPEDDLADKAEPEPTEAPAEDTPTPVPAADISGHIAVPLFKENEPIVYVISTDGAQVGVLETARQPAHTQDGTSLVVNGDGGGLDKLRVASSSGGNAREIGDIGLNGHSHPAWSPDGSQVIYDDNTLGGSDYHIYRRALDNTEGGGEEISAASGLIINSNPLYPLWTSQDRIIFRGCNTWAGGGDCGLWVTQGQLGQPERLTDTSNHIPTDVAGDTVLYTVNDGGGDWNVYRLDITSGSTQQLTTDPAADGLGTISPDGNSVAFLSNRGSGLAVWVMSIDGGTPEKLFDINPQWGDLRGDGWTEEKLSWGR